LCDLAFPKPILSGSIYPMKGCSLLLLLALAALGHAQYFPDDFRFPPPKTPVKVQPKDKPAPILSLASPDAAVAAAYADAQANALIAPFLRYIWVPTGLKVDVQATSFTLNTVSRAARPRLPVSLANWQLVRVDLRHYCPLDDLPEYLNVWEKLAFDPHFNLLITQDSLKLLGPAIGLVEQRVVRKRIEKTNWQLVNCEPYIGENKDGQRVKLTQKWTYDSREVEEVLSLKPVDVSKVDVLRLNGQHLNPTNYAGLQALTRSSAPIVNFRYFQSRALSAIQGDNASFRTVFGGLYYDFVGVKGNGKDKQTDEARILQSFGVDRKIFDKLPSDQRSAISRSSITKRPRQFEWFPTLATRGGLTSFAFITSDIGKEDIDPGQHPLMNLVKFKFRAREAIIGKPNGMHLFLLFNGENKLQEKAPDNVARNNLVPGGHSTELEPAISCIWCHGVKSKTDGWMPFGNSVTALRKRRVDIFGDFAKGVDVQRLADWYAGSPDETLILARNSYARAVLQATGPWENGGSQTEVVRFASQKVVDIYSDYWYPTINAHRALQELGLDVPKEKAIDVLGKLLAPDPNESVGPIIPVDIRIESLFSEAEEDQPDRFDFSLTYSFIAGRVQKNLARMQKK
jgi:hypothetical protein